MAEQTIFYISGSVFFILAIIFLFYISLLLFKILSDFSEISFGLKKTVNILKEKVEGMSLFIATIVSSIEKLLKAGKKRKKVEKEENT